MLSFDNIILMKKSLINDLNSKQKEAAMQSNGPSVILAGAGSGKTRVLVSKVLHLIEDKDVQPESILMVTFTNKAAGEMKQRVGRTLGFVGTFHSLCARLLRIDGESVSLDRNFLIYDEDDKESIIKDILKQIKSERKITPSYISNKISSAKDNLITPSKLATLSRNSFDESIVEIYTQYQKRLTKAGAVDFDDLLFKTVLMFRRNSQILEKYQRKFRYILIDEFQDTNYAQYTLTRLLAEKYRNITVVGDFAQSIYSWRGADIRNLEKFQKDFPDVQVYYLEENYRSTQNILDFAYGIISKNSSHPILKLHTSNDVGEAVGIIEFENEQEEAMYIATEVDKIAQGTGSYEDIAVLYRINAMSRVIEEAFLHAGIPYVLVGGVRFYARAEIKDILSYLRLFVKPNDEVSLKRVLKIGKKRFSEFKQLYEKLKDDIENHSTDELITEILESTDYLSRFDEHDESDLARLENIRELRSVALAYPKLTEFLEQIALVESEYSEQEKQKGVKQGVSLMTLHACKGLEFAHVFITGLEEGILPHSRAMYDDAELEEERRLFYVGATRAGEGLKISHVRRRFVFGRRIASEKSRFIREEDEEYNYTRSF